MNLNKFKNIFLDRDGIVNEVILRDEVISSPRSLEEFKFRDVSRDIDRYCSWKYTVYRN